jgi:hypothetical protein
MKELKATLRRVRAELEHTGGETWIVEHCGWKVEMAQKNDNAVVLDFVPADGGESEEAAAAVWQKRTTDRVERRRTAAMELKAALEEADGRVTDEEEKQYAARELKAALEAVDPEPAEGDNASFGAEFFREAAVAALPALQQSRDHRCLKGQCHRYTAGFKCAGVASPFTRSNDRSQCSQCSQCGHLLC